MATGITGLAIMLRKILTGGESGTEQAAWRAAKAFRIAVGGWMPEGFATDDGPRPEFAELYGSIELPTDNSTAPTEQNIHDSDATLWFGDTTTKEAQTTVETCLLLGKTCMLIYPTAAFAPAHVAAWLRDERIGTLTVAGNREAVEPGIGERVERFLGQVLELLGHERA
jgi:Circularly permutated YpsA SLOG family